MGAYTRVEFSAKLNVDAPDSVLNVLRYMTALDADCERPQLPEHPFFKAPRWAGLFIGNSAYHPDTCRAMGEQSSYLEADGHTWRLKVLSSVKDYNHEIELFCDWIAPYLDEIDGAELGSTQFDEPETGTRLINDKGVIVRLAVEAFNDDYEPYLGTGLGT